MKKKDFEIIKKLIEIMKQENLSEIDIKKPFFKVKLTKEKIIKAQGFASEMISVEKSETKESPAMRKEKELKMEEKVTPQDNLYILKSPLVGTFYRAPSPESPPYVEIGDDVKKGQVLCIIEAMKIMNEIESEVQGRIVEIMVKNAEPVEFGQPLFKIEVRK